jgi:hypothetical protein
MAFAKPTPGSANVKCPRRDETVLTIIRRGHFDDFMELLDGLFLSTNHLLVHLVGKLCYLGCSCRERL